jgi:hypothetical protein
MCAMCPGDKDGRHDGACPLRYRPDWDTPPRVIMRFGGPILAAAEDRDEAGPRGRAQPSPRPPAQVAEMAKAAAAMRAAGLTFPQIAKTLGVGASYACTLAKRGAGAG